MRIADSSISMASVSSYAEQRSVTEQMQIRRGDLQPENKNFRFAGVQDIEGRICQNASGTEPADVPDVSNREALLLKKVLERESGVKVRIVDLKELLSKYSTDEIREAVLKLTQESIQTAPVSSLHYNRTQTNSESQLMGFAAVGTVMTGDGNEIDLNLQLAMRRDFYSQENISLRTGDIPAVEPPAANPEGPAPELTDTESNVTANPISFLTFGSGFFAIDRNSDGAINDGSELFGPSTGNGFTELAAYDQDGDRWIDEDDTSFEQLRVWSKLPDGTDSLATLKESGIGAVYLGSVSTVFDIKNQSNQLEGQISRTGIYLTESGQAGAIQQIDLMA